MQGRGLGLLNTTPGRLPRLDAAAEGSTPTTILGVFPLPFWVLRVEATTPNTRTGYRNVFYKRSIRTRVRSFAFLMMLSFPKQTSEPCTIAVVGSLVKIRNATTDHTSRDGQDPRRCWSLDPPRCG